MPQSSIDDLRQELGLPKKGRKYPDEHYVSLHLAFRISKDDAKLLLLECEKLGTSESLYARQAILEKLREPNNKT